LREYLVSNQPICKYQSLSKREQKKEESEQKREAMREGRTMDTACGIKKEGTFIFYRKALAFGESAFQAVSLSYIKQHVVFFTRARHASQTEKVR
jgi:hypothetical protein